MLVCPLRLADLNRDELAMQHRNGRCGAEKLLRFVCLDNNPYKSPKTVEDNIDAEIESPRRWLSPIEWIVIVVIIVVLLGLLLPAVNSAPYRHNKPRPATPIEQQPKPPTNL